MTVNEGLVLQIDELGGASSLGPGKFAVLCPICNSPTKNILFTQNGRGSFEAFAECGCHIREVITGLRRAVDLETHGRNGHQPSTREPPEPPRARVADEPYKPKAREIEIYTAADLMAKQLSEPKEIVPGFVYEGFNLFAGKGKTGKSWYVLDLAIAVSNGRKALGKITVKKGDVLYLALEDTERRMKKRMKLRLQDQTPPDRLFICHAWPRIGEGCLRALRKWLDDHPDTQLVIIDVLKKIKPNKNGNRSVYDDDFDFAEKLKEIADEYSIGLIGVTHTRKAAAEDVFDEVNASSGLTGAADATIVWRRARGDSKARLSITGRDVIEEKAEDTAIVLEWNSELGSWSILGSAGDVDQSEGRQEIVELLKKAGEPMSPSQVVASLPEGRNAVTVRWLMTKMCEAGQIQKSGYGKYSCLPTYTPTNTPNSTNSSSDDDEDHSERWR